VVVVVVVVVVDVLVVVVSCVFVQDTELIAKSQEVIEGRAETVDITMTIHNAQRTFATTLSHIISM